MTLIINLIMIASFSVLLIVSIYGSQFDQMGIAPSSFTTRLTDATSTSFLSKSVATLFAHAGYNGLRISFFVLFVLVCYVLLPLLLLCRCLGCASFILIVFEERFASIIIHGL